MHHVIKVSDNLMISFTYHKQLVEKGQMKERESTLWQCDGYEYDGLLSSFKLVI